jgi:hypothetical protein
MAGKKRRVYIYTAKTRESEDLRRKDLTERGHNDDIGRKHGQFRDGLRLFQAAGLHYFKPQPESFALHRRNGQALSPPRKLIFFGVYRRQVEII